jgi:hypothetical protein
LIASVARARASLALVLALATASASAQSFRGDGVAAVVGGTTPGPGVDVVLHSDVELVARLALATQAGDAFAVAVLPASLLGAALEQLLGEVLIAREADRVQVAEATAEDRAREWERIEGKLGGPEGVRRFLELSGASEGELHRIAERRALVAAFLRTNLSGGELVSDADVERLYASGEHPFLGQDLSEVREALRVMLARRRLAESVARWVDVLRARTPMRTFASYARAQVGAEAGDEVYRSPAGE